LGQDERLAIAWQLKQALGGKDTNKYSPAVFPIPINQAMSVFESMI
jgi:hypothetical protein